MPISGGIGWKGRKLADLCVNITDGKHGDCMAQENSGFYFLSCKDIWDEKLNYKGAREITESDFMETHRRTRLAPNDILITNSGTIGRMAFVPDNEFTLRTTFQKSVAVLKPRISEVEPRFLFYALLSNIGRLIDVAGGTAQANLLLGDLRTFELRIPPRPFQERIANLLLPYDALIANCEQRLKVLDEMARALYQEWIVNFRVSGHKDGGDPKNAKVPNGWKVRKFGDLVNFSKGKKPEVTRAVPLEGDVPLILMEVFRGGRPLFAPPQGLVLCQEYDTLMVMDGSSSSEVTTGLSGAVGSTLGRFGAKEPELFSNLMIYQYFQHKFEEFRTKNIGSAIPHANKDYIFSQIVGVPPIGSTKLFDDRIKSMRIAITNLKRQTAILKSTRDLLLPRLLSGQPDVGIVA